MKYPSPVAAFFRMSRVPCFHLRPLGLAAVLLALLPRGARAESGLSYKYADYQEAGGRIGVETQGVLIEQDFGTATKVKVEGVIDALAGATPNGQPAPAGSDQVPLSQMDDRRKAWSADVSHQFTGTNLALGVANSRESDYVSTGASLNALTDFNQKNTTLLLGLAGTRDEVRVFYQRDWATKRTHDVIVGVTQLLDPRTSVTLNVVWGRQRGYLSDPYKLVQKDTEVVPGVFLPLTFAENRPGERDKWIGLASVNRSFLEGRGAVEATYRLYHDTYDTTAHTVDLAWFQRLGERLTVRPAIRFYAQSAAEFYFYRLDGTPVVPVSGPPRPQGPFYSSDWRLSEMHTLTYGVKLVFKAHERLHLDAAFERYEMRGRDGVTPQSAYPDANIVTGGVKFTW